MPRFSVNKGFYGEKSDDEQFLTPDGPAGTDPYKADDYSSVGYNVRWDDDAGTRDYAGQGIDGVDDLKSFLAPSWTGDVDYAHQNLGRIIDGTDGMGSGNKLLGGGGPVKGGGPGKPRYAPKDVGTSGLTNRDSLGGVDRTGRGRR
jgi:hypothetical protein